MIGIRPTNSQVGRVGYGYIYINQQMSLGMYVYLSKMGKHDQIYCNLWNSLGKINFDGCGWRSQTCCFAVRKIVIEKSHVMLLITHLMTQQIHVVSDTEFLPKKPCSNRDLCH